MSTLSFWQDFAPDELLVPPYTDRYRVCFEGKHLDLPLRPLPDGKTAVASLLVNQTSFRVFDILCQDLVRQALLLAPDLIVGMPTLGLGLAAAVAKGCNHERFIPLSTSRKFWYDDQLSFPLSSITTPDSKKRLYFDPNLLPLLAGAKRILLVDDVVSTGQSLFAAVKILEIIGHPPSAALCVMTQSERWRSRFSFPIKRCFSSPLFIKNDENWIADGLNGRM